LYSQGSLNNSAVQQKVQQEVQQKERVMRFRSWLVVVSLSFVLCSMPDRARGQANGSIQGTLTDAAGKPIAGAKVTISSMEKGTKFTEVTNNFGAFEVTGVPADDYGLRAEARGFQTLENPGVTVYVDNLTNVEIKLAQRGSNEVIARTVSIVVPAFLDTPLDSKKRNVGDQIEAKTTARLKLPEGTVIPRQAKIIGRITDSKARSKGDPQSSLTIAFEKVMLPQGKTLDIKGHLQAVAPNPNPSESGGVLDYKDLGQTVTRSGPSQTSTTSMPIVNAQTAGALGLKDLALDDQGVLTSPGKAVKLDHGSQLLLKIQVISQ
jgi:hypothetical protein